MINEYLLKEKEKEILLSQKIGFDLSYKLVLYSFSRKAF